MAMIPTAEEMEQSGKYDDYQNMMREFARLHVKAALKAAYNNATFTTEKGTTLKFSDGFGDLNKESILSAYPLTLIQ